jgi:threonyl-tRNA synthetase
MIHRAITGSIERFLGILIENTGGDFPLWLAPEQARVLPIADRHMPYADSVRERLREEGLRIEIDGRSESVGRRIRDGELSKTPYLLIVGDKEQEAGTASVRARHGGDRGALTLDELAETLVSEAGSHHR